jgi:hypothetical protein
MSYLYGRELGPNEKVYSAADYEALEKELADTKRSMMQKMDEADGEAVSAYRKLLYKIDALKAALAPFAKFEVPTDMRQKNYRGAVYTTTMISGQSTALTVDDFDSAREALEEKP